MGQAPPYFIEGYLVGQAPPYLKGMEMKRGFLIGCVGVLITDGVPERADGCIENYQELADIAGTAHRGPAAVRTFAVGMAGADFGLLDAVATEGGTSCGSRHCYCSSRSST